MATKRTKNAVGQIRTILLYRMGKGLPPERMWQIATLERGIASGQFFLDGETVHFSDEDIKLKKFIVYESFCQVQRSTRGLAKVKLRP